MEFLEYIQTIGFTSAALMKAKVQLLQICCGVVSNCFFIILAVFLLNTIYLSTNIGYNKLIGSTNNFAANSKIYLLSIKYE